LIPPHGTTRILTLVAEDLVLEQLKGIRREMATKADLKGLATSEQLTEIDATVKADLEALRGEMLRHFVEVATRVSQLERDVQELKTKTG
jgi:hypothetical protein